MTSSSGFVEFDKTEHDRKGFDCGTEALNKFLESKADEHRRLKISRTMVLLANEPVANQLHSIQSYYTIASTVIGREEVPAQYGKRLPPYPVPVFTITCLAVSKKLQGKGLGTITLLKALESLLHISKEIPVFAIVIDPIDNRAENLYRKYGFDDLGAHEKRLFMPMTTVEKLFS